MRARFVAGGLESGADFADNVDLSVFGFDPATAGAGEGENTAMLRYPDVTIKSKLYGLLLYSVLSLSAVLGLSLWVLHEYRVNGPVYEQLIRRTAALGDLEPAAFDMAEAYLILLELSTATNAAEVQSLKNQFAEYESHFRKREEFWSENLLDGTTQRALSQEVFPEAHAFYRAVKEEYLPLLNKGDQKQLAKVLVEKIKPRYLSQRQTLERAVKSVKKTTQDEEKDALQRTRFWLTTMIIVSIASVVATLLTGWVLTRSILRPTVALIERVQDMAGGASDLTARVPVETRDELGQLAEGINAMIGKIQTIVHRIREASVQLLSTAAEIARDGAAAGDDRAVRWAARRPRSPPRSARSRRRARNCRLR